MSGVWITLDIPGEFCHNEAKETAVGRRKRI